MVGRLLIIAAAICVLVGGIGGGIWLSQRFDTSAISSRPAATFSLTDQNGQAVSDENYRAQALLVFFGFIRCPDVCPTSMSYAADLLTALGPEAERLQVLFITVDPERDTPDALKDYLTNFDPRIVGLTGTPEQIAAVAATFGVYYAKRPLDGMDDYTMDHSTAFYFVGADGILQRAYSLQRGADEMTKEIRAALNGSSDSPPQP
jgi:protein SCO1